MPRKDVHREHIVGVRFYDEELMELDEMVAEERTDRSAVIRSTLNHEYRRRRKNAQRTPETSE